MKGCFYSIGVSILLILLSVPLSFASESKTWEFRVFLDDREIGYHTVKLNGNGQSRRVSVDAKFKVRFLFVTAYKYKHETEEVWRGDCLAEITSKTDDNGEPLFLESSPRGEKLFVDSHNGGNTLTGCIRSFTYWDPELLDTEMLLNTQSGEYQSAELQDLGFGELNVSDRTYSAKQFRLKVDGKEIDLWYTADNDWIALQTKVRGGRLLSYYREGMT